MRSAAFHGSSLHLLVICGLLLARRALALQPLEGRPGDLDRAVKAAKSDSSSVAANGDKVQFALDARTGEPARIFEQERRIAGRLEVAADGSMDSGDQRKIVDVASESPSGIVASSSRSNRTMLMRQRLGVGMGILAEGQFAKVEQRHDRSELENLPKQCAEAAEIPRKEDRLRDSKGSTKDCDDNLNGWYKYPGHMLAVAKPREIPSGRCGAKVTGYTHSLHPNKLGQTKFVQVCFDSEEETCGHKRDVRVINCGSFAAYYIEGTPDNNCPFVYCFQTGDPPLPCIWEAWSAWECKADGEGKEERKRKKKQTEAHGGAKCEGPSSQFQEASEKCKGSGGGDGSSIKSWAIRIVLVLVVLGIGGGAGYYYYITQMQDDKANAKKGTKKGKKNAKK